MPLLAKAQIFTAIGMLESYGEGAGSPAGYVLTVWKSHRQFFAPGEAPYIDFFWVHYTKGGKPGYYRHQGPRRRPDPVQPVRSLQLVPRAARRVGARGPSPHRRRPRARPPRLNSCRAAFAAMAWGAELLDWRRGGGPRRSVRDP